MNAPLHHVAYGLASLGRKGDSELVHMQPREIALLEHIQGKPLSKNPHTGLPEANSIWDSILPMVVGLGVTALTGGGGALASMLPSAISPAMAGGLAAGLTGYGMTGNLMSGVMSGVGGYSAGALGQQFAPSVFGDASTGGAQMANVLTTPESPAVQSGLAASGYVPSAAQTAAQGAAQSMAPTAASAGYGGDTTGYQGSSIPALNTTAVTGQTPSVASTGTAAPKSQNGIGGFFSSNPWVLPAAGLLMGLSGTGGGNTAPTQAQPSLNAPVAPGQPRPAAPANPMAPYTSETNFFPTVSPQGVPVYNGMASGGAVPASVPSLQNGMQSPTANRGIANGGVPFIPASISPVSAQGGGAGINQFTPDQITQFSQMGLTPDQITSIQQGGRLMARGGIVANPHLQRRIAGMARGGILPMPRETRTIMPSSHTLGFPGSGMPHIAHMKGFASGGIMGVPTPPVPPSSQAPQIDPDVAQGVMEEAKAAMLGEGKNPEDALNRFSQLFGPQALQQLAQSVRGVGGAVQGAGGGQDDLVPGTIDGTQPVQLANDEHVLSADVVSGIGGGSSEHGHQLLKEMAARVRSARTKNGSKMPPNINPSQYMPG